ncbi:MAG: 50S ribosomal protein L10 [Planctomycetes bacterium]|nr:50S ribosomal protein L10 [Planctomycetota bacterium]
MSRAIKQSMVQEYRERAARLQDSVLVRFTGVSAIEADDLRLKLRGCGGARLFVLRNALARLAFAEEGFPELGTCLTGSMAIASEGDGVQIVKTLREWGVQKKGKIEIRGGTLGRKVIGPSQIEALASLPDIRTMRAQVLATALASLTQVLGLVNAVLSQVPNLVNDHIRKQESSGVSAA